MSETEDLGRYVDRMICDLYVEERRFSGTTKFASPLHSAVIEYIEDEATGRPHPIDDSADHFLLRHFDLVRRDSLGWRVPSLESCGLVMRYSDEGEGFTLFPGNSASGEIPWRSMHGSERIGWRCFECGHHIDRHDPDFELCDDGNYVNDDGFTCYPCNCGNNTGR